jgi:hypothetical protein
MAVYEYRALVEYYDKNEAQRNVRKTVYAKNQKSALKERWGRSEILLGK